MIKRLTALTISLIMLITVIQFETVSVFAETYLRTNGGLEVTSYTGEEFSYDSSAGLITISEGGSYQIAGMTDSETIKITARGDVTLTLCELSITSETAAPIEIAGSGDVKIDFLGGNYLTCTSTSYTEGYAGFQKTSVDNTLTIKGSTDGTLTVQGGTKAAGIGGGIGCPGTNIIIERGNITATGGMSAAGIGGAADYYDYTKINGTHYANTVTITGGNVTAYGGYGAPGIGSGYGDYSGDNKTTITG
ncbi:MAG: carbohydrate-binding domain-containing protein [Clostridiales bacterium]|nr:carbohydrate-binding domain-containing protein [Clostridiales bacterium]